MMPSVHTHKRVQPALGSWFEITLFGACSKLAQKVMTAAFAEVRRLEQVFSVFQPESEVSVLNRAVCGHPVPVLPDLNHVLRRGQELEIESRRAFRLMPGCPHETGNCYRLENSSFTRLSENCSLDLGGIAKGAIVDHAFEFVSSRLPGAELTVTAGGDLRSSIADSVDLRINTKEGSLDYSLQGVPQSIATSSRSASENSLARYSWEQLVKISPAPARCPITATVQARSCLVADAMTKVALFGNLSEISFQKWEVLQVIEFDQSGFPQKVHS